jgi:hypothetical protein
VFLADFGPTKRLDSKSAFESLTAAIPFAADPDTGVLGAHLFGPIPLSRSRLSV